MGRCCVTDPGTQDWSPHLIAFQIPFVSRKMGIVPYRCGATGTWFWFQVLLFNHPPIKKIDAATCPSAGGQVRILAEDTHSDTDADADSGWDSVT